VKYVMDQVDHADSKMTLDVYGQMEQRAKRDNGARFDKLIRGAREQAGADVQTPAAGGLGPAMGPTRPNRPPESTPDDSERRLKP
jgi:hypothetical protein